MNIPKTMKAAILVEQNKPLVIDEVELPASLEVGQVLIIIQEVVEDHHMLILTQQMEYLFVNI